MADWIKWKPGKFLIGVRNLQPFEGWVYTVVLMMIYEHEGPIKNDSADIAKTANIRRTPDAAKAILSLISKEKLFLIDGKLSNARASKTLADLSPVQSGNKHGSSTEDSRKTHGSSTEDSRIKTGKGNEINGSLARARASKIREEKSREDEREKGVTEAVIKSWNLLAEDVSLPKCALLTQPRKAAILARLGEIGGLEGWYALCDRIRGSPHLTGKNERGWRVSLDWVLKPANLTKIMEGNYDDRRNATVPSARKSMLELVYEANAGGPGQSFPDAGHLAASFGK